ncbi:MAG: hypothetical protein WBM50_00305 [Acidimicrobiales bacterium]
MSAGQEGDHDVPTAGSPDEVVSDSAAPDEVVSDSAAADEVVSDSAAALDDSEPDDTVAPTTTVEPSPVPDIVRAADLENVAAVELAEPEEATAGGSMVATTTLGGTELISGLRGAGRHLVRPSASEGHLRTELTIAARRIDSLLRDGDAYQQGWAVATMGLIHDAGFALEQRRISEGWQLLRAAQTEMLEGLDRRSLLVERATISGREFTDDDSTDIEELRSEVWAMRQTKNRYLAELDRRLVEGGRGLLYRGFTLFGALVLGAIGMLVTTPSSNPDDALGGIANYMTIVGLATTGAAVSYVLFTRNASRSASISEVVNPLQLVLLRLAFGGVVGLLLVVLLQAGVQDLVNANAQAAYFWAVLGGFSERWVERLIDQVERSSQEAAEAACAEGV